MFTRTAIFDRKPLGQLLLSHGIVRAEQLAHAIDTQSGGRHQKLLGEILVEQNVCTEEQITQTLAVAYGVPFAHLEPKLIDPKALAQLPAPFVSEQLIVPMFVVEGVLTVAVAEPANVFLTEEIVRLSGLTVQVVAATARDIRSTLTAMLPAEAARPVAGDIEALIESQPDELQIIDADANAVDIRLARYWLQAALSQHAGELLIEPGDGRGRIRLRDGGRWRELSVVPADLCRQTVDLLIQLSAEQSNTLRCLRQGRSFDIPVAVTSTVFGPSLLLRLPDPANRPAKLDKLGLSSDVLQKWQTLSSASHGLLLITGPIASGKSSTLHATLREQLRDDRLINTVEHPLVHLIDGIAQTRPDAHADFVAASHRMLAGSADLCAIDLMSDATTMREAVLAACGGRLVIGVVADSDPAAVLHRLRQSTGDDVAVSNAVTGILSQRLVRKLCPACKQANAPTETDIIFFEGATPAPEALFTPRGCAQCGETGYVGRTGLFELLLPGAAMFGPMPRRSTPADWRARVSAGIVHSLRDDAVEKLRFGVTSVDEARRALA